MYKKIKMYYFCLASYTIFKVMLSHWFSFAVDYVISRSKRFCNQQNSPDVTSLTTTTNRK